MKEEEEQESNRRWCSTFLSNTQVQGVQIEMCEVWFFYSYSYSCI